MLNLFPRSNSDCQSRARRSFLVQIGSLAGLGVSLEVAQRACAAAGETAREANCILVWTRGGTSHIDSIDPKPEASADIRGDFSTISTAIPGVHFTEMMPRFAERLGRFALMRNLNPLLQ